MAQTSRSVAPPTEYPSADFPVVFADGVLNVANSATTVKYYLYRFDPSFTGTGDAQVRPFVQVVMPMDAFMQMTVFFQNALETYVRQGTIPANSVEEFRRTLVGR